MPDHRDSYLMDDEKAQSSKMTPCCSRSITARLVPNVSQKLLDKVTAQPYSLEKFMSSPEFVEKLPAAIKAQAIAGKRMTIQLNISTPSYLTIADGACTVQEGVAASPEVIFTASDENLFKLLTGALSGPVALFTGRLKVDGNLMLAKEIGGFFDPAKLV
jgi:putative sterol carrier protein